MLLIKTKNDKFYKIPLNVFRRYSETVDDLFQHCGEGEDCLPGEFNDQAIVYFILWVKIKEKLITDPSHAELIKHICESMDLEDYRELSKFCGFWGIKLLAEEITSALLKPIFRSPSNKLYLNIKNEDWVLLAQTNKAKVNGDNASNA